MADKNKRRISNKTKNALKNVTKGTKSKIQEIIRQQEDFLKENLDVMLKGSEELTKEKPCKKKKKKGGTVK